MDQALTFREDDTTFDIDEIEELVTFTFEYYVEIDRLNTIFLEIIIVNIIAVFDTASQDM